MYVCMYVQVQRIRFDLVSSHCRQDLNKCIQKVYLYYVNRI